MDDEPSKPDDEPSKSDDDNRPSALLPVIIIPTDQAWIVVLVSFCQNLAKDGIPLAILIFASAYPPGSLIIKEMYIIGASFLAFCHMLTPFSCALINWYSFRTISILGPAVAIAAMAVCYFVQDQFTLSFISLSLVGGLGCSMINATAKCMPSAWFCNRRGMVCQISGVGLGLGILVVPGLMRLVFEAFDKSITHSYWLFVGIYIPLMALGFVVPKLHGIILHVLNRRQVPKTVKFRDQETAAVLARTMSIFERSFLFFVFQTYHNLEFPRVKDIIKDRSIFMVLPDEAMMGAIDPPCKTFGCRRVKFPSNMSLSTVSINVLGVQEIHMVISSNVVPYSARPFYRVDIFFTSHIYLLNLYCRQTNQLDFHMAVTRAMSRKDYLQEINGECPVFPEAMSRTLFTMFHVGLWKNLYFIVLQVAIFFNYIGHFIPLIFIKDRGEEYGLKEEESFLLQCSIGCGNVAGRIVFLLINNVSFEFDHTSFFEFLLVGHGLFTIGSNYIPFFEFQAIYGFITGISMGLSSVLEISCLCKATGIFDLTNTMGYQMLSQGAGILAGTVISAYVNELIGTTKCSFHISGVCWILSGLLLLPMKKLKQMAREAATDFI